MEIVELPSYIYIKLGWGGGTKKKRKGKTVKHTIKKLRKKCDTKNNKIVFVLISNYMALNSYD